MGAAIPRINSRRESEAARLEPLEPRALLAALTWDGDAGNGLWSDPLNWSLNFVPRQVDDVTIDRSGSRIAVKVDAGPVRVNSLVLRELLVINKGVTLSVVDRFDIEADGEVRVNGLLNWNKGTWQGTRSNSVNAGGQLNIGTTTSPQNGTVTTRSDLQNAGRLAWRGGDWVVPEGTQITNGTGRSFDVYSPRSLVGDSSGAGLLLNDGVIKKRSGSNASFEVDVINNDRVYVLQGLLIFGGLSGGGSLTHRGTIAPLYSETAVWVEVPSTIEGGARLIGSGMGHIGANSVVGEHTLAGSVFVSGDWTLQYNLFRLSESSSLSGSLRIASSATLQVDAVLTVLGHVTMLGAIAGSGRVDVWGSMDVEGDLLCDLVVRPSGVVRVGSLYSPVHEYHLGPTTNRGELRLAGGVVIGSSLTGIVNSSTGTLSIGATLLSVDSGFVGTITNHGLIQRDSQGAMRKFIGRVVNEASGIIHVPNGTLRIESQAGQAAAALVNRGEVTIDGAEGELRIVGDFQQTSGTVHLVNRSTSTWGRVRVFGHFEVSGGTLALHASPSISVGFVTLLESSTGTGAFLGVVVDGMPMGKSATVSYLASPYRIRVLVA